MAKVEELEQIKNTYRASVNGVEGDVEIDVKHFVIFNLQALEWELDIDLDITDTRDRYEVVVKKVSGIFQDQKKFKKLVEDVYACDDENIVADFYGMTDFIEDYREISREYTRDDYLCDAADSAREDSILGI